MLLNVDNLGVSFSIENRGYEAVSGVSFSVEQSKTLSIVGESGCGKSITALSILRLLPKHNSKISSGKVIFNGLDLLTLPEKSLRGIRGSQISMIFQEPGTSLNPVLSVGYQLTEMLKLHLPMPKKQAVERVLEMMGKVGISSPLDRFGQYPHELSGGMKQRIMIAMALLCNPKLLIADEPTTALDMTIQAQILDLIKNLQSEYKMGLLLISHDLGMVAQMSDEVIVMYAGMIVEKAPSKAIFESPRHPYTQALKKSLPVWGMDKKIKLETIPGRVPMMQEFQNHCRFYDRCAQAEPSCKAEQPKLREISPQHLVRCFKV